MHQPSCVPVCLYLSSCLLGLLFCVHDLHSKDGHHSGLFNHAAGEALAGDAAAIFSHVLRTVLQTQLGVFVFSNFIIAVCATTAVATTSIFLGSLTPTEASRLTQRLLKYLLFKVALVGMVVLPKEVQLLHWLPWLAVIGELKMFVGLAKDRLAGLSVSPAAGLSRHVRTLCLLLLILVVNLAGMLLLRRQLGQLSWAISMLFGLDMSITTVDTVKAALSCGAMLMDEALATSTALELPRTLPGRAVALWEAWQATGRDTFFYRTELLADVTVHMLTLLHHLHVWVLHGLSFHLLDALLLLDTRAVVLSFMGRLQAHMVHRAATSNLDHTFPDASSKDLAAQDAECVICRDKLAAAKRLPCGHLFHLQCLRAWLQQSGSDNFTCPMCRLQLFVEAAPGKGGAPASPGTAAATAGLPAAAVHQRWRLAATPGLLGGVLSMSLDVLPPDSTPRQMQHLTLHERIAAAELLEAEGTAALASPGSGAESADGLEALADALVASVQLESSREHEQQQNARERRQQQQEEQRRRGQQQAQQQHGSWGGAARIADDLVLTPEELAMIASSPGGASSSGGQQAAAAAGAGSADEGCCQAHRQHHHHQQPPQLLRRPASEAAATAAEITAAAGDSGSDATAAGSSSRAAAVALQCEVRQRSKPPGMQEPGSRSHDSDTTPDTARAHQGSSAAAAAGAAGSRAGSAASGNSGSAWACSRSLLASLMSKNSMTHDYDSDESSCPPSPGAALFYTPAAAPAAASHHEPARAPEGGDSDSEGSGASSRRCHAGRRHQARAGAGRAAAAGAAALLSRSGSSSSTSSLAITAGGDSAAAADGGSEGDAAGDLLLQLLTSPREPHRRRNGGRWGRRRWLAQEGGEQHAA